MTNDTDATELLKTAITAAHAGGRVLQEWVGRFSVTEKKRADLVTEADHASQKIIHEIVSTRFPDHGFLGEEGLNHESETSPYRWIIDPLDGTSNYVHGFPYYAVSIAVERDDTLIAGVIYDPTRDETFSAVQNGGAKLNGVQIQTSGQTDPLRTMGVASLPVGASRDDPAVDRFLTALGRLQTVQRTGSAALNLACVACGRIDVFWSSSLKPWDVAAGALIVREAGGTVTNLQGDTIDIMVPGILAASSDAITQCLLGVFAEAASEPSDSSL